MRPYTEKQVGGAIMFALVDLPMLFGRIFGFDTSFCCAIVAILSFIPGEICIPYLNKRIEAEETEELKEDLKDDISRISLIALVIAGIVFCILGLLMVLEKQNKWL